MYYYLLTTMRWQTTKRRDKEHSSSDKQGCPAGTASKCILPFSPVTDSLLFLFLLETVRFFPLVLHISTASARYRAQVEHRSHGDAELVRMRCSQNSP